jgi:integrase/recombinase XerC
MKNPRVPDDPQAMEIVTAYVEHLRRAGKTDATLHYNRELLGRLDRDLPYGIGSTTREELSEWLYRDTLSQNTKCTYYNTLKRFYEWATDPDDPWLNANPAAKLEPVKWPRGVARPITDEELGRILTEAADPYRLWARIAAYQGLRCIEISRLDREHITEHQLFVVKGKGGRPRVHDTDPGVWAAVKDLPAGPIAMHPRAGRRATPFEVSSLTAEHFRRQLHMPGVGLHRLRHWLGVTVQRKYKDIRVTQAVLGHASLQSTQVYTAASDEQQRAARATLPRFGE